MEHLSKRQHDGLTCPRCGKQMNILGTHGPQRCPSCGFWRKTYG